MVLTLVFCWIVSCAQEDWYKSYRTRLNKNWIKNQRHNLADKLEAWGKRNGLYAVPMVSTNGIKNEMLRNPLFPSFTSKERHIRQLVRKFAVTQPASIGLILSEIKHKHPYEYSIASSEFEVIKNGN